MQRIAQDWLVLQLAVGSGGAALGITTGLQFLPFLLLTPVAGLVADRMPKQRLLQLTNLGMAVPAFVLGLLAVTGVAEIWHVYLLAFVLGTASAFDAPARQSFVSELVEPADLTNAVGLNSASFNAARLIGPGLAGFLIAALGGGVAATGWVILFNAVSYAAPIWSLRSLDSSLLDSAPLAARGRGALREGVAYVRARPDLMLVLALVFVVGTFGLNFQITSALMATEVYGKGPGEFGLLGTFLAVGSLTGALLAARRPEVGRRLVVGAGLAFGVVVVASGFAPSYVTYAVLAPVSGLLALTFITSANTYMQLQSSPGVRGRVMALYLMVFMGGTPVGAPVIGWVAEAYGARWSVVGGGLVTVVGVAVAAALFLAARRRAATRARVVVEPAGEASPEATRDAVPAF
jgi:MFS family permease